MIDFKAENSRVSTQLQSWSFRTAFARLTLVSTAAIFFTLISGLFIRVSGLDRQCADWITCGLFSDGPADWVLLGHRGIVLIAGIVVVITLRQGWRTQRLQTHILSWVTLVFVFFLAQILSGIELARAGESLELIALHAMSSSALWFCQLMLVLRTGLLGRSKEDQQLDAYPMLGRRVRYRDFLMLTKPIIVVLLLVTTFTGMVVAGGKIPAVPLLAVTLLGGAMAAGGSGAINQYIDREVDRKMQRTARRPVASGRLTPAEALAFGIGIGTAGVYLIAIYVNVLAAFLSLLGGIYYVWLYSLVLKKSTDQNIVIGGGAGSIPPLVGWAAVTGSLTIAAGVLFLIIFFWTPPHFWALALVRSKDYESGGIPMMPVVRGQKETLRQIWNYTLILVAISLLPAVVHLGGLIYVIAAALLGSGLIVYAWRLRRKYSAPLAWRMYKYSSMYLLLLFLFLALDALI